MLVKSVNESPHPVIPQLDHAAVKTREDPWPLTVETQSLHSITLGLEFRQHYLQSQEISNSAHTQQSLEKIKPHTILH